jgi:hypothetical protein
LSLPEKVSALAPDLSRHARSLLPGSGGHVPSGPNAAVTQFRCLILHELAVPGSPVDSGGSGSPRCGGIASGRKLPVIGPSPWSGQCAGLTQPMRQPRRRLGGTGQQPHADGPRPFPVSRPVPHGAPGWLHLPAESLTH